MKIISENTAAAILFLLITIFVVSGNSAAIELKELTTEEVKEIKLFENSSTSHRWELEIKNHEVVSLLNNNYEALESRDDLVGRGGIHSWCFKAEEKGFALVNFNLLSPEDQKQVKQKSYLFAVDLPTKEITDDEILEIKLAENPSTGYRWQFELAENKNLQLLQQEYKSFAESSETRDDDQAKSKEDGSQIIVGQGGIKSLTFRGLEAGYQLLTFKLARSDGEPIKTVEYLVLVK